MATAGAASDLTEGLWCPPALGPEIQWLQSFVTDDKIYCVYIAPDEATVRAHAQLGGFPVNSIARVHAMIDPTTAESDTVLEETDNS